MNDLLNLFGISLGFGLFYLALFFVFYGGFCLLIRPLILWYFKINKIIQEQENTNFFLEKILEELEKQSDYSSTEHKYFEKPVEQSKETDYSKYMPK